MNRFAVRSEHNLYMLTEIDDAGWKKVNERGSRDVNGLPVYIRVLPDGKHEVWPRCLPAYEVVELVPVEVT